MLGAWIPVLSFLSLDPAGAVPVAEVCARRPLAASPVAAVALSDATGDVWLAREPAATVALRDAGAIAEVPTC